MSEEPTYVVTVKYGKEKIAEQEIGDAVFPADPEIRIEPTPHKGVLIVFTDLPHKEFMSRLKTFPPSTVERVVRVSFCCSVEGLVKCVREKLQELGTRFGNIRFGRKGSLGGEGVKRLKEILNSLRDQDSNMTLVVEPINGIVCFGLVNDDEDKFRLYRLSKLSYTDQAF